ncbi:MAG: SOS response-associated peptidase [Phycisphaeraceae bacterium]|nr:MAG: SOS response-associated peptidase [Phycisphaeraceae bacterium]
MCGRISLNTPTEVLAAFFGVRLPAAHSPRYNIAPSQPTLILRRDDTHPGALAALARWGFVPAWRRTGTPGPAPINARAETAAQSRLFAEALRRRRCVVPASGFYEWQAAAPRGKRPFHISSTRAEPLALAGLWSPPAAGCDLPTFAVLTCPPNAVMRPIHDRMPVVLAREDVDAWLDPACDPATIDALLRPAPDDALVAREVSTRVNSPAHDDPACLEPPPPPPPPSPSPSTQSSTSRPAPSTPTLFD